MGISSFLLKCKRVWFALRKTNKKEFWTVTKVSAAGIVIIGIFGFAISALMKYIIR